MREGRRPLQSVGQTWSTLGWTFVVVGTVAVILGIFICPFVGVRTVENAYGFYDMARLTTEGTVRASHQKETLSCTSEGACADTVTCITTVSFTPRGQGTSFTTTDTQCNALNKGTRVKILYNPHRPSMAKTSRQASEDVTNAIVEAIIWPGIEFFFIAIVLWGLLDKKTFCRYRDTS